MKRILIDSMLEHRRTALIDDGELIEIIIEDKSQKVSTGNIYIGTVKKILSSQFAFIDLGDKKNAFLHLSDKRENNIYSYNSYKNKNELKIKQGDEIVVQVMKEAVDEKGAVVTTQIMLSGKYTVLLCGNCEIGVSKKIDDLHERKRLINIAENFFENLPKSEFLKYDVKYGIIMRTCCQNTDSSVIIEEVKSLIKIYENILEKGHYSKAPYLIYSAENEIQKLIRDLNLSENDEIIINDYNEYLKIIDWYNGNINIIFYNNNIPLFDEYFVEKQIEKTMNHKIWLKCGGFIVIDYTEACTVIDVNTGKFSGKNHNATVLKTNKEAAYEIAKQIRLRNISGMIIIDFIDMNNEDDRNFIYNLLVKLCKNDRVGINVVGMTELGLMQLTRKKIRQPIYKSLMCTCPCCNGSGSIFNEFYIADKIKNEIISIFSQTIYRKVIISSNSYVINAFKGKNNDYTKIEKKFNSEILFNNIQTQKLDYYKIEKI